jgi:hypothetical protein
VPILGETAIWAIFELYKYQLTIAKLPLAKDLDDFNTGWNTQAYKR